jgi:hypothetical protein
MVVTRPTLPAREERLDLLAPACRELLEDARELGLTFDDVQEVLRRTQSEHTASD